MTDDRDRAAERRPTETVDAGRGAGVAAEDADELPEKIGIVLRRAQPPAAGLLLRPHRRMLWFARRRCC